MWGVKTNRHYLNYGNQQRRFAQIIEKIGEQTIISAILSLNKS